jgi:hypothetical protein
MRNDKQFGVKFEHLTALFVQLDFLFHNRAQLYGRISKIKWKNHKFQSLNGHVYKENDNNYKRNVSFRLQCFFSSF